MELEYVDLVFSHRPDPLTPMEETVRAFNYLIDHGMAFYWGTSEWSAQQITEATEIARRLNLVPPHFDQPQYNMFTRERVEIDYAPLYQQYGYGLTIWSPLASGILTGKYSGGKVPEGSRLSLESYKWLKDMIMSDKRRSRLDIADRLKPIATQLGCTLAQLAIAWCLKNKNVPTIILGATSTAQLDENIEALTVEPRLTPDIMTAIEAILDNQPQPHESLAQARRIREWPCD